MHLSIRPQTLSGELTEFSIKAWTLSSELAECSNKVWTLSGELIYTTVLGYGHSQVRLLPIRSSKIRKEHAM
jgi:hypothetical protein